MIDVLGGWENFYVIIGSSAAALTGLQFVVIALIHDAGGRGGSHEVAAYGTPTVIHFGATLLLSAILSAPWMSLRGPAIAVAAVGMAGVIYTFITWRRAGRTKAYTPVLEDWIWHVWIPLIAYLALVVAAFGIDRGQRSSLFMVAAASLMLLFDGIHNAWDTVTYVALEMPRGEAGAAPSAVPAPGQRVPPPPAQTTTTKQS
jgi:hypothetical protein